MSSETIAEAATAAVAGQHDPTGRNEAVRIAYQIASRDGCDHRERSLSEVVAQLRTRLLDIASALQPYADPPTDREVDRAREVSRDNCGELVQNDAMMEAERKGMGP